MALSQVLRIAATLVALMVAACAPPESAMGGDEANEPEAAIAVDRWIREVEPAGVVPPFLSPQGFLDPAFSDYVAHPSPHLTDFFGLQAVRDVARDEVIADFVPRDAEVVGKDDHSVTLAFREGYQATFFPQSGVAIMGQTVPISHVAFQGEGWREIAENIRRFMVYLDQRGLTARYLLPNPFLRDELAAHRVRTQGVRAVPTVDPSLALWRRDPHAVLLLPEVVHGAAAEIDQLVTILREGGSDWLGLEMLYAHQQPLLDGFNAAAEGSPAYLAARDSLEAYFTEWWNGRSGPKTTGAANPYFALTMEAHRLGVAVHALEASTPEYLFFRYGEAPFGGSVRSYQWANRVPREGRGIVFGGSAHFTSSGVGDVQDYLAVLSPGRLLVSLRDLGG